MLQNEDIILDEKLHHVAAEELMNYAAKIILQFNDRKKYASSRINEIDGLTNRGFFMPVALHDPHGHRIYSSCFVDYGKHEATP